MITKLEMIVKKKMITIKIDINIIEELIKDMIMNKMIKKKKMIQKEVLQFL